MLLLKQNKLECLSLKLTYYLTRATTWKQYEGKGFIIMTKGVMTNNLFL
jgi:hypothetical protein